MIIEAILKINPNAQVVVRGNDINTCEIEWHNETTPISKSDIKAKMIELQAEYNAEEWKRNRQTEYPKIDDCIHALLDGGETLENLQTLRQTIKNKYPKE
jgi:NOL1/NOP2/fmu family ribosome biogenesis protein